MPNIEDFGFEKVDEVPIKRNEWGKLLEMFMKDDSVTTIMRKFDVKRASNKAAAIRRIAEKAGIDVEVVVRNGNTVYISKRDDSE